MKRESQRIGTNSIAAAFKHLSRVWPSRFFCLLALVCFVSGQWGCRSSELLSNAEAWPTRVTGQTLVYQFPSGRTYQAEYGCEQVEFVLLQPQFSPPPSKMMPFSARAIRPGLDLVVWEDPEYHTTFVVDLERRMLHASASRGGGSPFLGQAEIVEIRDTRDASGSSVQCASR